MDQHVALGVFFQKLSNMPILFYIAKKIENLQERKEKLFAPWSLTDLRMIWLTYDFFGLSFMLLLDGGFPLDFSNCIMHSIR